MTKRDGYESRKKYIDNIRLKPKYCNNGQSASKPWVGEGSTTRVKLVGSKLLVPEVVGILLGWWYSLNLCESIRDKLFNK